jgi:hypothetical protein
VSILEVSKRGLFDGYFLTTIRTARVRAAPVAALLALLRADRCTAPGVYRHPPFVPFGLALVHRLLTQLVVSLS